MTSVVVVEYRVRLLSIRQELLRSLGHPIIAVHGSSAAAALDLSLSRPGVIVIGHRDSLDSREAIRHFRNTVPKVPSGVSLFLKVVLNNVTRGNSSPKTYAGLDP